MGSQPGFLQRFLPLGKPIPLEKIVGIVYPPLPVLDRYQGENELPSMRVKVPEVDGHDNDVERQLRSRQSSSNSTDSQVTISPDTSLSSTHSDSKDRAMYYSDGVEARTEGAQAQSLELPFNTSARPDPFTVPSTVTPKDLQRRKGRASVLHT